jgi:hypothetical protein
MSKRPRAPAAAKLPCSTARNCIPQLTEIRRYCAFYPRPSPDCKQNITSHKYMVTSGIQATKGIKKYIIQGQLPPSLQWADQEMARLCHQKVGQAQLSQALTVVLSVAESAVHRLGLIRQV